MGNTEIFAVFLT